MLLCSNTLKRDVGAMEHYLLNCYFDKVWIRFRPRGVIRETIRHVGVATPHTRHAKYD